MNLEKMPVYPIDEKYSVIQVFNESLIPINGTATSHWIDLSEFDRVALMEVKWDMSQISLEESKSEHVKSVIEWSMDGVNVMGIESFPNHLFTKARYARINIHNPNDRWISLSAKLMRIR
ncbi:hypothetical protein ACW5UC_24885 [Priestia aryabhattai]|uniref:hypothetical protein n=1 Tax=Priestia megaterium TaxID=1404 RepID=UPI003F950639